MKNDMLRFKPTLITTCFGMNDGGYAALTKDRADLYRESTQKIIDKAKKAGYARSSLVRPVAWMPTSSEDNPPCTTRHWANSPRLAREVAEKNGVAFADVHTPMMEAMEKAKAKYGKEYHVAGGDGVHPDDNGHLVMAYAFLKALGCDGDIGKITVDLARIRRRLSTVTKCCRATVAKSKSRALAIRIVSLATRRQPAPPPA